MSSPAAKKAKKSAGGLYEPGNILVTGGAGFIASHVVIELVKAFPKSYIVCLDKLDYVASLHNLDEIRDHKNFKFVKGDICSPDLVSYLLEEEKIDTILHLAAQSHVDNSFGNSLQFTENNIMGTHVLLECSKVYGKLRRFVHISTDEVYGEIPAGCDAAVESETLLTPTNPYSATKAAAEFMVLSYHRSFGLPIVMTRGNNVYGPHQFPEKLIPKLTLQLAGGKKCTIHGDGSHKRSFLYVTDVARALRIVMQKGAVGQIYNIGTHFELSNIEVCRQILAHFPDKKEADYIEHVADRPFNDCRYAIDSSKLHALGWKPEVEWKEGLTKTINWYLDLRAKQERGEGEPHWDPKNVEKCLVAHPRMGQGSEIQGVIGGGKRK